MTRDEALAEYDKNKAYVEERGEDIRWMESYQMCQRQDSLWAIITAPLKQEETKEVSDE